MGAGAEIRELALLVEGDMGVCGQVVDKLHLVGLCLLLHELQSLLPGQLEPLQLQLLLADLPHLRLDLLQMLHHQLIFLFDIAAILLARHGEILHIQCYLLRHIRRVVEFHTKQQTENVFPQLSSFHKYTPPGM